MRFAWSHPEWWSIALSAAAWITLAVTPAHHHAIGFADALWLWSLMTAAMMLPLAIAPIRHVAFGSLWSRRHRAIACFLAGYLGTWMAAGVVIIGALRVVPAEWNTYAAVGSVAIAIGWRSTSTYQRALRACQRVVPLAPHDPRASLDALRYGWLIGRPCVITCWPLMIACALAGHTLVAMAALTLVAVGAQLDPAIVRTIEIQLVAAARAVGRVAIDRRRHA